LLAPLRMGPLAVPLPLALAPMAGVTNAPFRMVCREMGAGLAWTEMACARALVRGHRGTGETAAILPGEGLAVAQIFGRDPGEMAQASRMLAQAGAHAVDLNFGCPVKKILKSGSGAQLMREPALAEAIVAACARALPVPLTVKIRLGWDEEDLNFVEFARRMAGAGAAAVTLHPRTRVQGFTGRARWELIAVLKQKLAVPVLASGDVRTPEDALELLRLTGCDGLLVGRGALGRPWVFAEIARALGHPDRVPGEEGRRRAVRRHLRLIVEHCPGSRALPHLRKHLAWYSRGHADGAAFRRAVGTLPAAEGIIALACSFFGLGAQDGPAPVPEAPCARP
jgi:tRNA-dihydrouridine synthase B